MPYADKEKDRAAKKKSWLKHREEARRRQKARYAANPEHYKARAKKWRDANREQLLARLKQYKIDNYEKVMWIAAKARAKKAQVPFRITVKDIIIPQCCPVLGLDFEFGKGKWADGSPSLDRVIPKLGYVPGNIRVISWRANCLKRDGTAEEFELIAAYLRGEL